MDETLRLRKNELRKRMKTLLAVIPKEELERLGREVTAAIEASAEWREAEILLAFSPLPGEVDLRPLIQASLKAGKIVGLPRIAGDALAFHAIASLGDASTAHAYGMLEPGPEAQVLGPENLRGRRILVLTPGLAFDRRGGRIGRGKGFYDRFFRGLAAHGLPPAAGGAGGFISFGVGCLTAYGVGCLTAYGVGCLTAFGVGYACQVVGEVPMGTEDFRLDGFVTEEGLQRPLPPDPENFARDIVSRTRKTVFLSSLRSLLSVAAGGAISAFLIVRLGEHFSASPNVVVALLVAAEGSLVLVGGYFWYRYVKALREEDE